MRDFLLNVLETGSFPPQWEARGWTSGHGWLHIFADGATFAACVTIPFVLLYFLRKRPEKPLPKRFYLLAAFAFSCGAVFLFDAIVFWWPAYRLSALVKLLTALASLGTVAEVVRSPSALTLAMQDELVNENLQREKELQENRHPVSQSERLSKIGQAMTGLIHESRNALARSQAGLRLLSKEIGQREDLLSLIDKSLSAQQDLQRLFETVGQYASPSYIHCEESQISEVVEEAWDRLANARSSRDASIECGRGSDAPCSIDRLLVGNVFRNLIENSLAACEDPVRIAVSYETCEVDHQPAILIRYRDNGPGLSEEQGHRAFEAFYTTKKHGTGLGLAICRQTVEAHGGKIEIGETESGAEFYISLPRKQKN